MKNRETTRHAKWFNALAFALGAIVCCGVGTFLLASPVAPTQVAQQTSQQAQVPAESLENLGEIKIVQEGDNVSEKGAYLTVSQWNTLGVYGSLNPLIEDLMRRGNDPSDPAGQAIWQQIQYDVLYGDVTIYDIKIVMKSPINYYSTTIKVVGGSTITANGNALNIGGTIFTTSNPFGDEYAFAGWKINNEAIPSSGIEVTNENHNLLITADFGLPTLPWTNMGIYAGNSDFPTYNASTGKIQYSAFEGYRWVSFADNGLSTDSVRYIIIGEGRTGGTGYQYVKASSAPASAKIDSSTSGAELANGEVLLLRERVLADGRVFDTSSQKKGCWSAGTTSSGSTYTSDIKTYLNGTYYNNLESDLKNAIQSKQMRTAWYSGGGNRVCVTETEPSKVFLLATTEYYGSDISYAAYKAGTTETTQNFCIQTYLGSATTRSNNNQAEKPKYYYWELDSKNTSGEHYNSVGNKKAHNDTDWGSYFLWLRSGDYNSTEYALCAYWPGYVNWNSVAYSFGVRPAFVLNVAGTPEPAGLDVWDVTLDANGGTITVGGTPVATHNALYLDGDELPTDLPTPSGTQATAGKIFGGWYDNPQFSGAPIVAFSQLAPNSTTTLFARWVLPGTLTLSEYTGEVETENTISFTASASNGGTIAAESSDTSVATVSVSGSEVTITGVAGGAAAITVSCTSATHVYTTQTYIVTVGEPWYAKLGATDGEIVASGPWTGYYKVTFDGTTWWTIIGGSADYAPYYWNNTSAVPSGACPVPPNAFVSSGTNVDGLTTNQILLISSKWVFKAYFDNINGTTQYSLTGTEGHSASDTSGRFFGVLSCMNSIKHANNLNGTMDLGLAGLNIIPQTLRTYYGNNSSLEVMPSQYLFPLAAELVVNREDLAGSSWGNPVGSRLAQNAELRQNFCWEFYLGRGGDGNTYDSTNLGEKYINTFPESGARTIAKTGSSSRIGTLWSGVAQWRIGPDAGLKWNPAFVLQIG